jgi:[ribosomal protein S5]-alanine N-acetyltransferase
VSVLETARLRLRPLTLDDAAFIFELVNDAAFIRFIGDKGVKTLDDARGYLLNGPLDSYKRHGFGLLLVEMKSTGAPIGICGLVKRPALADPDIGYALLPGFRGAGYAVESATAVLDYGQRTLRLPRVLAITDTENAASIKVVEAIGLRFERQIRLGDVEPEINLYSSDR